MEVIRAPSTSRPAPQQRYSGVAWIGRDVTTMEPSRLSTFHAQFNPGARTAWHRYPYGRVLHVLHGTGRVQRRGGPVHEVKAGDTIVVAPGEWHWHGAAPTTFVAMVSTSETDPDTAGAEWGDPVTDREYERPPRSTAIRLPDEDRVPSRDPCW
ncbi:cupin domain-containing protein [Dactylosporangium sp. NPDC051541]|uniref:cupin domain-containing protein n=1 Tax=Dactylosporangium sp. NPDC051541 TaxID=3363977 RepID=UPI0037B3F171